MATIVQQSTAVSASPRRKRRLFSWQAWLWIGPALVLELIFYLYPLLTTIWLSFFNKDSTSFVGWRNYVNIFTDRDLLEVLKNNLLWIVLATVLTVGLGLVFAVMVDRIKLEGVVKSALFVPMAISFVGIGVIWRFVFDYNAKIGLLNAIVGLFGGHAQGWLVNASTNNFLLILVYTWTWTGFCMVILSAALKGIPDEIMEAARIDGAGRFTIFWRVMIPMISSTIAVITTTMVIYILKIFDIVYVMTGGFYHTNVIALEFYQQLFNFNDYGKASGLAVILLIAVIPVVYINVRRMRAEEATI